jgi:hypothetical protein
MAPKILKLVTSQSSASKTLCKIGWLCHGRRDRLLTFRGNLLHGVVPGGGCDESHKTGRRITFMVAFWKSIRVQDDESSPGSAWPFSRCREEEWAAPLLEECANFDVSTAIIASQNCFYKVPVWHDVDEEENKRRRQDLQRVRKHKLLPPYDAFFQFYTQCN